MMKKVIKYVAITLCALFLILLLAPLLFKKQLVTQLKKAVNSQLAAQVDFDNDISLSFIRNFPNASLGVSDLSVVGEGAYQGDTLAYVRKLHLVIDLSSLFGGETYQIRNVSLDHPYIQLLVDSAGKANWDITLPDTTQTAEVGSSSFKAALQQYSISDGRLVFSDTAAGFFLDVRGLDHRGQGDFSADVFDLDTRSEAQSLRMVYGGIPYLDDVRARIISAIHIDVPHGTYSFKNNTLTLNGLTFNIDGSVALPDTSDIQMDLAFKASENSFKNFLSLIPAIYQKDFDKLKASGTMAFNGTVKGVYNDKRIPAFNVQLSVADGMFRYPDVPEPLSDVNLNVTALNPDGNMNHTVINVKQLHFKMGANPFDAHLTLEDPMGDPRFDGAVTGKLNLSEVSRIYPLEKGTSLAGALDLDIAAAGTLSQITGGKYGQLQARGHATASQVAYQSASFPAGIRIPAGTLAFSPERVGVKGLQVRWGKSDVAAEGQLNNFFSYLFGKDALKGILTVNSHLLNLNELMARGQAPGTDTTSEVEAVKIPRNITFSLAARIDRFIYDTYDLHDVSGKMTLADGVLDIDGLQASMLGGSAQLSGTYDSRDINAPKTDMNLKLTDISIPQAFKTFNTVQALAPVAAFAQGSFSGDISLSTLLDQHLFPKLSSLNSIGKITIPKLDIKGFKPLQQLASGLGMSQFQRLNLDKLLLSFAVDSGFLKVKPFDFSVDGIQVNAAGKNGLDKTIDYTLQLQVPRSKLGDANTALQNLANQASKLAGSDVKLDSLIPVGVQLGGTLTQPTVKLDLSEGKQQLQQSLTHAATQKLNQEKNKVINQLFSTDSAKAKTDTAAHPAEALKKSLEKGIKGLFQQKKSGEK